MSHGPDLEHLAAQLAEHPGSVVFAALAEGLRKRGDASGALAVVTAGIDRHPRHLPGYLVMARLRMDGREFDEAGRALREALRLDPAHPAVLEALAELSEAAGDVPGARAWREALDAALPEPEVDSELPDDHLPGLDAMDEDGADSLLSESLAALYHRQGHLDRAHQAYSALAARDPGNADLAARRDAIGAELVAHRPLPYDARMSGGLPLRNWLAMIAAAAPETQAPAAGYDAFFEPDPPAADETTDFEAFQSWLRGLPR